MRTIKIKFRTHIKRVSNNIKTIGVLIFALSLMSAAQHKKTRIFMAGDSTMQSYHEEKTLMRGWGQLLPTFFDSSKIEIFNQAIGGRSTKSFQAEGRWQQLLNQLQKGDYVFIQFGHNDASVNKPERYTPPADYKSNLIHFVNDVRAKKAIPVLVTPIVMRKFTDNGVFKDGHGMYPDMMREAANETGTLLIDMHRMSMKLITELGPTDSKKLYMNVLPGEHPAFPNGLNDNTHLREKGARAMAQLAVDEIKVLKIKKLIKCLKE